MATMTHQETFDKGVQLRLAGNEAFKTGDYKEALTKYYHAILHLRTVGGNQHKDEFKDDANKQLLMIYNNMATVLSKQNKWERVLDYSKKARELDENNVKAKFRMGQAYLRLGAIDKAKPLLQSVLDNDPEDALVKHEMEILKQEEKKMESREKTVYRNMISKMA
ncbi:Tetratricopeptide repeat protein 9A [Apophysomyces ossiformis]|uniref:Tetratricopeptide repeat protein 9A n=1 Tax=Apophysomyces ossiformis TaxID=679940 RepID=A0A8H7BUE0_9FUNG|nr:Tetratricopeptide repeat protein 9A [Apophysomyces ossiformis]